MERYHISGVPITDDERQARRHPHQPRPALRAATTLAAVSALMTSSGLVTAPIGTTLAEAEQLLHRHRIEKLPIVDADGRIKGLITVKDIQKRVEFPQATKDTHGRLRVGAAVGVGRRCIRARAGADRGRRRRARRRHRARALARRDRHGRAHRGPERRVRGDRRQHRDRRGGRCADRRRRRRLEGRASARARSARRASSRASACRRSPRSTTWPTRRRATACR